MKSFRDTLDWCGLIRVPLRGYKYTWDNKREAEANTQLVLDKAFLNANGFASFPFAQVKHVLNSVSDHQSIVLMLHGRGNETGRCRKRFLFENAWIKVEECRKIVEHA